MAKLRWIERHEPDVFSCIATVFGSYDYINYRLTGSRAMEQNWALEAGFVDISTGLVDEDLIRLAHVRPNVLPPGRASHEIMELDRCPRRGETGRRPAGRWSVGGAADVDRLRRSGQVLSLMRATCS